ncbi:MAG: hypothetical protein P4M14_06400 [Gammaproteobacteria bacterium]|nr:hypothetical protein [Gammaproteobacteria bacterium]
MNNLNSSHLYTLNSNQTKDKILRFRNLLHWIETAYEPWLTTHNYMNADISEQLQNEANESKKIYQALFDNVMQEIIRIWHEPQNINESNREEK